MMDIRSRPRVIHSATGTKDLQMVCLLVLQLFSYLLNYTSLIINYCSFSYLFLIGQYLFTHSISSRRDESCSNLSDTRFRFR